MKRILLGASCALALSAGHALADGYVGASYGQTNIDIGVGSGDVPSWKVNGGVVLPTSGLSVQLDGEVANYDFDDLGGGSESVISPTVHLFKSSDRGLIGGFLGLQHADGSDFWGGGVEGRLNASDTATLSGSLGYGQYNDLDLDVWSGRGEGKIFVTPNVRLSGSLNLVKLEGAGGDTDLWTAGLGGAFGLGGGPLVLVADYEHTRWDDLDLEADTFRLGLRLNFGGGAATGPASMNLVGMGGSTVRDSEYGGGLGGIGQSFGGSFTEGLLGSGLFDELDEDED